jgi:hypothetical protein
MEPLLVQQLLWPSTSLNRKVYFLTGASVSVLVATNLRRTVAVDYVGSDGSVGFHWALGVEHAGLLHQVQTSGGRMVNQRS